MFLLHLYSVALTFKNPLRRHRPPPDSHTGIWGISAAKKRCRTGRGQRGVDCLGGDGSLWAPICKGPEECELEWYLHAVLTFALFCFCFRIKWSERALAWQSDSSCYGTTFGSAALPWCPLHGPTIFNTGPVSCSLLSHNGWAGFPCSWHCPKLGTCEFQLARPQIDASSSHRPCSHGESKLLNTPFCRPSAPGSTLT